jgi:hypothetical protein
MFTATVSKHVILNKGKCYPKAECTGWNPNVIHKLLILRGEKGEYVYLKHRGDCG